MKPDTTILLRLVRASAQGIADECTAILGSESTTGAPPLTAEQIAAIAVGSPPPAVAEPATPSPATPPPAKRGRKPAAPAPAAEPAVVSEPPAPTNVSTEPAPQPAIDLGKSSVTETELASAAGEVKADPAKLARYFEWRNQSTFNTADGGVMSGEGKSLAQIPNVGDNWDRLLEALKRAAL